MLNFQLFPSLLRRSKSGSIRKLARSTFASWKSFLFFFEILLAAAENEKRAEMEGKVRNLKRLRSGGGEWGSHSALSGRKRNYWTIVTVIKSHKKFRQDLFGTRRSQRQGDESLLNTKTWTSPPDSRDLGHPPRSLGGGRGNHIVRHPNFSPMSR